MEKLIGIYCIENTCNNKKYIGQSVDINNRWRQHKNELNQGIHFNDYLQKSWNKYGENSFLFYVLEECDELELNNKERFYIEKFNTMNRNNGYNLRSGGQDYCKCTESTCNKIREAVKKTYLNPERKQKQIDNALKQWANPNIKQKIIGENNGMYGKHHTEESKRKMSENKKGTVSWRRNRTPVLCIELNKEYDDATDAAKRLFLDSGGILKVCQGKRHTCGGYHWKFITDGE